MVPVQVDYACDVEGCTGEMRRDGNRVLATYPPRYPHVCTACGKKANLDDTYPTIRFKKP